MRYLVIGLSLVALAGGVCSFAFPIQDNRPGQRAQGRAGQRSQERGRQGGPPPPPLVAAIDKNNDGEISADELSNAAASIKSLDKNKNGEITEDEMRPDFGRGGRGPGRGPGGRGGRGPGRGPAGRGGGRDRGGRGFPFFGFGDRGGSAERIAPEKLEFVDGVAKILDHTTFHKLAYKGEEVLIDTFLADLEFIKFTFDKPGTKDEQFYFINTKTHRAHMMFGRAAGLPRGRGDEQMKGVLVYRPRLKSPSGKAWLFTYEFEPFDAYTFKMIKMAHDKLVEKMPILKGNIGYYQRGNRALQQTALDKELYAKAKLPVFHDEDLTNSDIGYLPLNMAASYGRLRLMKIEERPSPRDVVIYKALPNEMPRVAGIITEVRQTPLSHVNLRAVQDKVPNAFIDAATSDPRIKPLIGQLVAFKVTPKGYEIRAAKEGEVEAHFAKIRPKQQQVPKRDLAIKEIRSLDSLGFEDAKAFGVKAANLATLRTFGFPEGTVPSGHAIPFHFYVQFMSENGLFDRVQELLADEAFRSSRDARVAALKKLRAEIKKAQMPADLAAALSKLHKSYPAGTSLRCRSSTNNEDLPGFSGAGLYDSFTHRPDEGYLEKSVKQVFASLWNLRAFEERDFYRVDHLKTAMGLLVHPNYKGEQSNGVAVTNDILYGTYGNYYLNMQVGEDLVTNPEKESIPEEALLDWWESSKYQLMRASNRAKGDKPLLTKEQVDQLRKNLGTIHRKFAKLYGKSMDDDRFAMEIEFKITKNGKLTIKQARPWVFAEATTQR